MRTRTWLIVALLALPVQAFGAGWKEVSNHDGIQVWRRDGEDVAFKGQTLVNANIKRVFTTLYDVEQRKKMLAHASTHRLVKRLSPRAEILYTRYESPFFLLQDRDFYIQFEVHVDPEKRTIHIPFFDVRGPQYPEVDGAVRLPDTGGAWVLHERGKKTLVTYQSYADPGGWIPKWVANVVNKRLPRATLVGLRNQIRRPARDRIVKRVERHFDWSWLHSRPVARSAR